MTYALVLIWTMGAHAYADTIDHGLTHGDCRAIAAALEPFLSLGERLTCAAEMSA